MEDTYRIDHPLNPHAKQISVSGAGLLLLDIRGAPLGYFVVAEEHAVSGLAGHEKHHWLIVGEPLRCFNSQTFGDTRGW